MPASILFDTRATGIAYINPQGCKHIGLKPWPSKHISNKQLRCLHCIKCLGRATHCMVDPTEFSPTLSDETLEEAILIADGTSLPTLGMVDVPISIQGYKGIVHCTAIDLSDDYDIILNNNWPHEHGGVIDYRYGHIRVVLCGWDVMLRVHSISASAQQP